MLAAMGSMMTTDARMQPKMLASVRRSCRTFLSMMPSRARAMGAVMVDSFIVSSTPCNEAETMSGNEITENWRPLEALPVAAFASFA